MNIVKVGRRKLYSSCPVTVFVIVVYSAAADNNKCLII